MTQEHITFLYKHKVMYDNFVRSQTIPHLSGNDAKTFLEIAKTFQPNYSSNLFCSDCVMELVQFVYTQAGKKQSKEAANVEIEIKPLKEDRVRTRKK